ncbi:DUF3124 domain-containing protein [Flavisolibacter ginsenosidimutans]|uniref:DUF3124 domain-containing protein n=1 Tax=Flavisolibacter ginsenosidimutans TaxID=661481 RepID=A0A5B8UGQ6_9BACT|nr:DUF3124 domain-containing protein [Flavisolibacter ginsenosidimutans]QEC55289.1 DUF3124 domain-containing protein [Flavisolibacter ginsenosidimutans]
MKKTKQTFAMLCLLALFACQDRNKTKTGLPSRVYHYVSLDTTALADKHAVYVPVYSHIYTEDGTTTINLGVTLSVRNTSSVDSFYVTDVVYYGSQGEILKHYLPSPVIVKPMSSVEFVVERVESEGGAGANFVVKWGATKSGIEPLIQTVMIESAFGISFVTNGIEMK